MSVLRLLIVEGNPAAVNAAGAAAGGRPTGERYADVLRRWAPDADIQIVYPTEGPVTLDAAALARFDGAAITGSALNLYDGTPDILRQIELARALISAGVPIFGSCWGLQVGVAALGGRIARNPRGREVGIARRLTKTQAGRAHPMLADRPDVYEAICVHLDEVAEPAPGLTVLAANDKSPVQAAEWRDGAGRPLFWGVQYHPEHDFREISAIMRRYGERLSQEGAYPDEASRVAELDAFAALAARPADADAAARLKIDAQVLEDDRREAEIGRWIRHVARPRAAER